MTQCLDGMAGTRPAADGSRIGFTSARSSLRRSTCRAGACASADEPYLAKSYSISLIFDRSGASGGTGRRGVGWHLEAASRGGDLLRLGRQRPVVELLRLVHVLGAGDQAQRADLVAGALAGRHHGHRLVVLGHVDDVVLEGDADERLALARGECRSGAGLGVFVDVLVAAS